MNNKSIVLAMILSLAFAASILPASGASSVAISTARGIDEYIVNGGIWYSNRQILSATGLFGVSYYSGTLYFCDSTAGAGAIRSVNPVTGDQSYLAQRGVNTPEWTTADPQNIKLGPDGKLYFCTAFGGAPNANGVFRMNTDGSNFEQFIAQSGTNWTFNNSRDLEWMGTNLFVGSRNNNNIYKFDSTGALAGSGPINSKAVTSASSLMLDGNILYIGCNSNGTNSIRSLDIGGSLPAASDFAVTNNPSTAPANVLGMIKIDGVFYFLAFNSGANSHGAIYRLNGDKSFTVVVPDLGSTANDFTVMEAVTIGPLQAVEVQVKRSTMAVGTIQQATVLAEYFSLTNDVGMFPGTIYTSDPTNVISVSTNGLLTALNPGVAQVTASYGGKTGTNLLTVVSPPSLALIHRYGFTNDASDSIGDKDGTPLGLPVFDNGSVSFNADFRDAVDFGGGAITGLDEVSFEAWVTFGVNANSCRLFDFGDNDGINGTAYVDLLPHSSAGTTRIAIRTAGKEEIAEVSGTLDNRTNVHVVAVFRPLARYMKLYLDGQLVAQNTNITQDLAGLTDNFNYLGQSQFFADPGINMTMDEFRVYAGFLDVTNVAFDAAAGPDVLVTDPGLLQSISLALASTLPEKSAAAASVRADYSGLVGVNILSFPGVSFMSSDTNVATVDSLGLVTGVSPGRAAITVSYGGKTSAIDIAVTEVLPGVVLVADSGNNRVLRFETYGTNWIPAGIFAAGTYSGMALSGPRSLAIGNGGAVYVGEAPGNSSGNPGGRILKFSSMGQYLGSIATNGVDYLGNVDCMTADTNGSLYFSAPFTPAGQADVNLIYKIDAVTGLVATNVPATDGFSYTLDNPRGLAFGPDGALYVANRAGQGAAGRSINVFDPSAGVWQFDLAAGALNSPNALEYDKNGGVFLASVNSGHDIVAIDTNGVATVLLDDSVSRTILEVLDINGKFYFSDFSQGIVGVVTGVNSAAKVVSGLSNPGALLVLPPAVQISLDAGGDKIVVKWPGGGTLQASPGIAGPYTNVVGAASPYTNGVAGGSRFFRVRFQ